jgi:hypothetical protein
MFLYSKEGALSPELCNSFIETFEASDEKKPGVLYGANGNLLQIQKNQLT